MAQREQTEPGSTPVNSKIIKGILDLGRIETGGEKITIIPADQNKELENLEQIENTGSNTMVPEQRVSTKILRQKLPSVYEMYKFLREDEKHICPNGKVGKEDQNGCQRNI